MERDSTETQLRTHRGRSCKASVGVQAGMVQRAVDCCCRLSQWARAVELAQEHGMQLDNLLEGRAAQLRAAGRAADEVTLFKKAAQHHRSAQLLVDLAKRALVRASPPPHAATRSRCLQAAEPAAQAMASPGRRRSSLSWA